VNRPFHFQKCRQYFVGAHNETLSVTMSVHEVRSRKDLRATEFANTQ